MRTKIDNEVRPSTVKTWLTSWRSIPTQPTDHWLRAVAELRMRTPYATIILARMNTLIYPTRPRREMQSNPRHRSLRSTLLSCRGPPGKNTMIFTRQLLTGNSVEIVRAHSCKVLRWRNQCVPWQDTLSVGPHICDLSKAGSWRGVDQKRPQRPQPPPTRQILRRLLCRYPNRQDSAQQGHQP